MTRRIISILLVAVLLVFSFAACGDKDNKNDKDNKDRIEKTDKDVDDNDDVEEVEDDKDTEIEPDYINEDFDFGFCAPKGWSEMSDEDIQKTFNVAKDMIGVDIEKMQNENDLIVDTVYSAKDGSSINVIMQKNGKKITDVKTQLKAELASVKSQYSAAGISITNDKLDRIEFAGKKQDCIRLTLSGNGVELDLCMVMMVDGDYTCMISTSVTNGDVQDIIDCFVPLD